LRSESFKKTWFLKDDGRVGKSTLERDKRPVETRIRQIALNMDRLRWLSDDMDEIYIFVISLISLWR